MKYKEPFTLLKRGKYWYYRVYVGTVRKTRSTGQTTKAGAMEYVLAKLSEHTQGMKDLDKSVTFKEYAKDFWTPGKSDFIRFKEKLGKHYSPRYLANAARAMRNHIIPVFGDKKLNGIRAVDVQNWVFVLSDSGLSPKTANNVLSVLHLMLDEAVRLEIIKGNPCEKVKRLSGKSRERGRLTFNEAKKLFSSLDYWDGDKMRYTANLLAAVTGMRSREVAALRGQDIKDEYIVVDHSYDERYGLKGTKTGDHRQLPVNPYVLSLLNELKRGDDDWLFTIDGVKPVGEKYFIGGLYPALERTGITEEERKRRNITFHSWRHFLNSILLANGTEKIMVQRLTGHTTDAMTDHYAEFNADDYKSVLGIVSGLVPK